MGAVGRTGIAIRPMGVGEVLDAGFKLARQHYRLMVATIAWVIIPAQLLSVLITLVAGPVIGSFGTLISSVLTVIATLALLLCCAALIDPEQSMADLTPSTFYRQAWSRLGVYILLMIVYVVAAIPLLILLPVGIYVLVRWSPAWMIAPIEGVGPIEALRRSWRLTRGAWWHTFAIVLAATLILAILTIIIAGIFGAIGGVLFAILGGWSLVEVFSTIGGAVATIVTAPFSIAISVVLYYELRARNEGFDLELRARGVQPIG